MNPALWAALGGAVALLLVLLGAALATLVVSRRARAREQDALAAARADVDTLVARVDELSAELAASRAPAPAEDGYLITTAGGPVDRSLLPHVPERAVLSVTVGEPLVKLAAFGYGLRRALSAESRNRIAFEMRREAKRARKARRRAARRTRVTTAPEETAA
ncbi:MAG TPA: hypothetical protein VFY11_09670 [Nocardioidaceae bacterium]|nr:hypothetical protein [Nocardioidaceae bacterium]